MKYPNVLRSSKFFGWCSTHAADNFSLSLSHISTRRAQPRRGLPSLPTRDLSLLRARTMQDDLTKSSHIYIADSVLHMRTLVSNGRVRLSQVARLSSATCTGRLPDDFPLVMFSRTSGCLLGGESPFAAVFPDVITASEEEALMQDLEPIFRRKRYEKGHWDSVIEDYKESERLDGSWSSQCQAIVDSLRASIGLPSEGEGGER